MADTENTTTGDGGKLPKPDMPGQYEGETMTRRAVFSAAVQAVGGVAVAGVALPTIGFAVAPLFSKEEMEWQSVGPVDSFTDQTYKQAIVTIVPDIGESGKTTVYVRRGSATLKEDPDEFIAISTRCAHLGCPVRFVEAAANFICPCHGGVYDFEGKVLGGPPVRPLDRFQTRIRNGEVEIGDRYSVTSQLEPVRTRDPGEFTGGIWEYLYPPRPSVPAPPK